jgi:hypothetical protein
MPPLVYDRTVTDSRAWIVARRETEKRERLAEQQGEWAARAHLWAGRARRWLDGQGTGRDWAIAIAVLASVLLWTCSQGVTQ